MSTYMDAGAPPMGMPPMGGMEGGAPPPAEPGFEEPEDDSSLPEKLQGVLNFVQELLRDSEDPEVQAAISNAESALSKLMLLFQKQKDAAMGTTPAHKFIERENAGY